MKYAKYIFPLIVTIALVLIMLKDCSQERPIYYVEADKAIPISIERFEPALYDFVHTTDTARQHAIADSVGIFWDIYAQGILSLSDAPYFTHGLQQFLSDSAIMRLCDDVEAEYPNLSQEEEELSWVLARYKALFPDATLPQVQTHISGLGNAIVTVDSLISISLDCFLGEGYELYPSRYNRYELPHHNRSHIVPAVAGALLNNSLEPQRGERLLDAMIYEGKKLFLLSALLNTDDAARLMVYSPEQVAWCNDNEANIWSAIVEQNHLYTSDNITVRKYIQPAPFTATLTSDAPGRVGCWVGWRIYQRYVEKSGLSPAELVNDLSSPQEILSVSGYNGK